MRYVDTNEVLFPKYIPENPSEDAHFRLLKDAFSLIESWKRYTQIAQPIRYSKFAELGSFPFELSIFNSEQKKKLTFIQHQLEETKEITLDFPGECGYVHLQEQLKPIL